MPKPTSELPDNQVVPNPRYEKRTYRYFSAADKKRILAEADACAHGELGELLRREKVYTSQQRQPVQRKPVQDLQTTTRLPWTLCQCQPCAGMVCRLRGMVQLRPPTQWLGFLHPGTSVHESRGRRGDLPPHSTANRL